MDDASLLQRLTGQLTRLCQVVDTHPGTALDLLREVLGPAAHRPLSEPPVWPSEIADDHTPVEFSLAFNEGEPPTLRILAEAQGSPPGMLANVSAAERFIGTQGHRFDLSTSRFGLVRDLFATEHPHGDFVLWHSLVFRSGRPPELKVYFNPEVKGVEQASGLVAEGLRRLGLGTPYRTVLDRGLRPGELGRSDRLTFFSVDLHDGPQARVKLYVTHHRASLADIARAAGVVNGVDPLKVAEFCEVARGRPGPFDGRPLLSSYTFTAGAGSPTGYSVYMPIRSYVADDAEARDRALQLLDRYGFDGAGLDRAIAAVTRRPLHEGVGLIAHVSLRLGPPRPGVTVYLSAEAYRIDPPRRPRTPQPAARVERPVGSPAGRP